LEEKEYQQRKERDEMTYSENKIITQCQNSLQEGKSLPYDFKVEGSHEAGIMSHFISSVIALEKITMADQSSAPQVRLVVDCYDKNMIQKPTGVDPNSKALKEEIKYVIWLCPCRIQCCQYHCVFLHCCRLQCLS